MSEIIGNGSSNVANIFIEKAEQHFIKKNNESQNNWFENEHKAHILSNGGNANDYKYDRNNYERVEFKSQRDVLLFVNEMNNQGVDVVATPFKQNGKYFAEIDKSLNGTDAKKIINDFAESSFVKASIVDVNEENKSLNDRIDSSNNRIEHNKEQLADDVVNDVFVQNLGSVGTAISYFQKVERVGEKLDSWNGLVTNKTATVYGNETVVIDGKIVTDNKIKESVLKDHEKRTENAEKVLDKGKVKPDDKKKAENVLNSIYKQDYEVNVKGKNTVNIKEKWSFNELDKYADKINLGFIPDKTKSMETIVALELANVDGISAKQKEKLASLLKQGGYEFSDLQKTDVADKITKELVKDKNADDVAKALANSKGKMTKDQWKATYSNIRKSNGMNYSAFLKSTFALSMPNKELALAKELKNVDWLKGTGFFGGAMTAQKLVSINAEFLKHAGNMGYEFVGATGKFDINKLKNLSAEDLKKLGITENIRDMLVEVNKKGSFGKDSKGNVTAVFGAGLGFILKIDDNKEGYADIQQLQGYVSKGYSYGKDAITNVKKVTNATKRKIDTLKAKHSDKFKSIQDKLSKKGVKPHNVKAKIKKSEPDFVKKIKQAQQNHYANKLKRKAAKVARRQKGLRGAINKATNKLKKKVANSLFGKLFIGVSKFLNALKIKLLAIAGGGFLILGFGTTIIIIICTLVIALIDLLAGIFNIGNWFAPQTYKDTVAYALATQLAKQEDVFVETLNVMPQQDIEKALNDGNTIRFGFFQEDASQYTSHFDNLVYIEHPNASNGEGKTHFKINPFWQDNTCYYNNETDKKNVEYMTDVTNFDGTHTYEIATNLNYYNLISYDGTNINKSMIDKTSFDDEDIQNVQYGVSNGHTSNIKDIIAMTDVMYQMEASEDDDEGGMSKSILGRSPAQLNIDHAGSILGDCFKAIGNFFAALWDTIVNGKTFEIAEITRDGNAVSYATVHNYAFNLFEMSHQIYLYLNVEYCDMNKTILDVKGNDVTKYFTNSSEKLFGVCSNPYESDFPLGYRFKGDDPHPVLEGDSGRHFLDCDENEMLLKDSGGEPFYDVAVYMENCTEDVNQLCLWEGMYPASYKYININTGKEVYGSNDPTYLSKIKSSPCWYEETNLFTQRDYEHTETGTETIIVGTGVAASSSSHTGMTASEVTELYTAYVNKYRETHPDDEYYYLALNNDNVASWVHRNFTYHSAETSIEYHQHIDIPAYDDGHGHGHGGGSVDITIYRHTAEGKFCHEETRHWKRDCHGHNFKYCGGHVSTHSQGNIFSVTNEQLAITGIYDKVEGSPLALYDSEDGSMYSVHGYEGNEKDMNYGKRYEKLEGKVIKHDMDYTTAYSAANSGGGKTPLEEIYQGTAVSKGLNIIVDNTAGYNGWGDGLAIIDKDGNVARFEDGEMKTDGILADGSLVYYCRDIFDCDCLILKGNNILPYTDYSKYEGWTDDNMTLVCNRIGMDWYEAYGFDLSMEIGEYNYALSEQDIDMLIVGMKEQYKDEPSDFTERTELVMRELLHKVGHGHFAVNPHYSKHSILPEDTNHAYLGFNCCANTSYRALKQGETTPKEIYFSGNCEACNYIDLVNYMIEFTNKSKGEAYNPNISETLSAEGTDIGEISDSWIKPLNVFVHKAYDLDAHTDKEANTLTMPIEITGDIDGYVLNNYYLKEQACIIVAGFGDPAFNAMEDFLRSKNLSDEELYGAYSDVEKKFVDGYIINEDRMFELGYGKERGLKLSTGAIIGFSSVLSIDVNQNFAYSGLMLRCEQDPKSINSVENYLKNFDITPIGKVKDEKHKKINKSLRLNYYWVYARIMEDADRLTAYRYNSKVQ